MLRIWREMKIWMENWTRQTKTTMTSMAVSTIRWEELDLQTKTVFKSLLKRGERRRRKRRRRSPSSSKTLVWENIFLLEPMVVSLRESQRDKVLSTRQTSTLVLEISLHQLVPSWEILAKRWWPHSLDSRMWLGTLETHLATIEDKESQAVREDQK